MSSSSVARVVGADGAGAGAGAVRVRVRDATPGDMTHIHRMIHELAKYEGVPDGPRLTVQDLIEDAFESSPPWCFALVAELIGDGSVDAGGAGDAGAGGAGAGGELVGYALCNRAYSSWTRRALYVEDLYVRPQLRSHGIGTQLLASLCQMGVELGVHRIDWHVLESNTSARRFYSSLGARCLRETEGRAALRLDAPHIERLAARARAHQPR